VYIVMIVVSSGLAHSRAAQRDQIRKPALAAAPPTFKRRDVGWIVPLVLVLQKNAGGG
jgi:hypothetical protein